MENKQSDGAPELPEKELKKAEKVNAKRLRREAKEAYKEGRFKRKASEEQAKTEAKQKKLRKGEKSSKPTQKKDSKGNAEVVARLYKDFEELSFIDLEARLMVASTREERAFYRALLNLKLQIEQEKVVGEVLL